MRKYFESTALLTLFVAVGTAGSHIAFANPEDGVVSAGSATITVTGKKLDIHQATERAVIDWRSFNIAPDEHTQFHQPGSSSVTVNRISTGNPSQILGRLSANGNVVIVNPSGVMFGKDAKVDVNGLVATTNNIDTADFMAGNMNFTAGGHPDAAVVNHGTITAKEAGLVGLVAPHVTNTGTITAKLGKVELASGDSFSVDLYGDGLMNIALSDAATRQIVNNSGSINAAGGTISMTAVTGAHVVNSLITIEGELNAPTVAQANGTITISGDVISHTGTMDVSGTSAGTVSIKGRNISQQGQIIADSTTGTAGLVDIDYTRAYLDKEAAKISVKSTGAQAGNIKVAGASGSHAFVSGTYDASSTDAQGGKVEITAKDGDLKLFGAKVKADGKSGGGQILIGGDYQGTGSTAHAKTTSVNFATTLSANATGTGKGGKVIVWSDDTTLFGGKAYAKGGALSGDGGLIEISSKDTMKISGNSITDASAAHGAAGSLLLDPKNIIVATGGINGGISSFEFIDPDPDAGTFGQNVVDGYTSILPNGNVLIQDIDDDFVATDAGAVYLFNGATGALISSLYGGSAGDRIGFEGFSPYVPLLANGNAVVVSRSWDNGAVADAGATTFINAVTGASGIVSAANSLVGSTADDGASTYITTLTNGNYVVHNRDWDNGAAVNAGAVTWVNGTTGLNGTIGITNSLVGSSNNDRIGGGVTELTNGNFVIQSYTWNNGPATIAGAATWVDGNVGIAGAISNTNSLVGTKSGDYVGIFITALPDGNYLARNLEWGNGIYGLAGALTWANGTTGMVGDVSVANSLVGSYYGERVGDGIEVLPNGDYVTYTFSWSNGGATFNAGAVTHLTGGGPISGTVSAANSIVGSQASDYVGLGGITVLPNGNYVINSWGWSNGVISNAGAVTFVDPNAPIYGTINASNSLVGTEAFGYLGQYSIIVLSNSNYLVPIPDWDDGITVDVGAVVWGSGTTGVTGVVDATKALIGSTANDRIGFLEKMTNGNYLVGSTVWDNGAAVDAGAVAWGNGATGSFGVVSTTNSIYGTQSGDEVGAGGISIFNSTYAVISALWDKGVIADAGAVTWADSTSMTAGAVSAANSLVGSSAGDGVGSNGIVDLGNGYGVILSAYWDKGAISDAGAATWVNLTTGLIGTIDVTNSLVGSSAGDQVGSYVSVFANHNYAVTSSLWDDGVIADVGAVTWADGSTGITGEVDITNSIIGSTAGDMIGEGTLQEMAGGTYLFVSPNWDNGSDVDVGAITFLSTSSGTSGYVSAANSFIGPDVSGGMYYGGVVDTVNSRYLITFTNSQRVFSISTSGGALGSYDAFNDLTASTITIDPAFIESVLNTGTAVTLQASNDITITDAIAVNNAGGDGGVFTLQAGRSIFINNDITTDNGDLYLYGNEDLAAGVVNAQRDAGNAVIRMGAGATIDAGTGDVVIRLDNGAGKTNRGAGDITLRDIIADTITAFNRNTTGDVVLASGSLDASGAGSSIILSSLRNFINNVGASAFNVAGGSNWLVYSTRASQDTTGGLLNDYTLDGCLYEGSCPALLAGNGLLYSFDPNAVVPSAPTPPASVLPPTVLYVSQTSLPPVYDQIEISLASLENGIDTFSFADGWIYVDEEVKTLFDISMDKI